MSKIIEKIRNDPRVADISDEREYLRMPPGVEENGDGFWVYLKGHCIESAGWDDDLKERIHREDGCLHTIHENSPSECLKLLRWAKPCTCSHCMTRRNG